ncbi:hypothetical protein GCM10023328_47550 [Modestobacter marinus]|uniref:Uncharacterized protein n=1 Tax=Modestobacter marinus TaxID=477641 RepID=A0ABQ2GBR5_9ACTN|nr:hypothetical protein [Modestobacter marinus]GGL85119.1 hypothetical protein GCM10011589_46940 [Modestobacter marinus]
MSSPEELQAVWRQTSRAVAAVVDQLDPEGLLAGGAPGDEYAAEAAELTRLVIRGAIEAATVLACWESQFGPGSYLAQTPQLLAELTQRLSEIRHQGH